AGLIGQGTDHRVGAINNEAPADIAQPQEKVALGMSRKLLVVQRSHDMLIGLQGQLQLFGDVMQDMGKDLRVRLIAHVAGKTLAKEPIPDGHKGAVFTIGHGGHTLNEEGVAGVEINAVVGVLASLGETDAGLDPIIVQAEGLTDPQGPPHLFDHGHIRPQGEGSEVITMGSTIKAQSEAGHHQRMVNLFLGKMGPGLGLTIHPENILMPILRLDHRAFDLELMIILQLEALVVHDLIEPIQGRRGMGNSRQDRISSLIPVVRKFQTTKQ
ncbi:MAG: hypothetical protein ABR533_01930, partial [Desulfonatronovibrio sp.]